MSSLGSLVVLADYAKVLVISVELGQCDWFTLLKLKFFLLLILIFLMIFIAETVENEP